MKLTQQKSDILDPKPVEQGFIVWQLIEVSTIWPQRPNPVYIKEVEGRPDTTHREAQQ